MNNKTLFLLVILTSFIGTAVFAGELEDAIRAADAEAVSLALKEGEDPNTKTDGGAPVLVLASALNATDIAIKLIAAGADVNAVAPGDASALMYASEGNNADLAKHLLDAGAEIDRRDSQGDPAVNWGAYYGSLDYILVLLDAKADTTLRGHGNAYEIALRRGHEETTLALANYAGKDSGQESDTTDSIGRPLIHVAARSGDIDAVAALLDAGVDVDIEDTIEFTALMHAARDGQTEVVLLLLEYDADVNHVASPHGLQLTALHLAAITNQIDVVAQLIDVGATLDVQGSTGQTPFAWSVFEGSRESALLLLQAGADWHIGPEGGPNLVEVVDAQGWQDVKATMER